MSPTDLPFTKRTIVRIIIVGAAVSLGGGCSALPQRNAHAEPCPPTRALVCDAFGAERRCMCSDWSRVDRQLGRPGLAALGLHTR